MDDAEKDGANTKNIGKTNLFLNSYINQEAWLSLTHAHAHAHT